MNPSDPNEPLPTTPVVPEQPASAPPPAPEPPRWGAPPPPPPTYGPPGFAPPPPGWGAQPPAMPPPPPPRRDRLALGIVAFIFGGLFLVFFGFLLLAYGAVRGEAPSLAGGPRIGVVEIRGEIGGATGEGSDADHLMRQLRKFGEDDGLKAVVIRIDSPGGAVGPSQELHDEVRRLAKKKTVVCSLGGLAASGGFYIAVACPKIVAEPGTLTGSIGVISMFPNVKGLAERFDVRLDVVKSGPLKDAGSPFRDMTPQDRAYWQALIDRVYAQFLRAVVEGRKVDVAKVREIADGRVITGEEAKERGLVDALGNFYDAVDLAKTEAKLTGEPNLVYPPDDRGRFLERLMGSAAGAVVDAVSARMARDARAAQAPGVYFLAR